MKFIKPILALLFYTTCFSFSYAQSIEDMKKVIDKGEIVKNVLVVKLKNNASQRVLDLDSTFFFGYKAKKMFPNTTSPNKRESDEYGLSRIYKLAIPEGADLLEEIKKIQKYNEIEYVEPSYRYKINTSSLAFSNDYYLTNIKAKEAWNITTGNRNVVIAIVDAGVDYRHPSLRSNLYVNSAEVPNNGIDDDQDGYVDNYHGWDFVGVHMNNNIPDSDPSPGFGNSHGTHVAGIAVGAQYQTIAGVAYDCRYMALKCSPDRLTNFLHNLPEAIKYATNHGANIINCSFGAESSSESLRDAINYATSKGVMVVAAAGNTGKNEITYPAAYPNVISVANVDSNDRLAVSSTYHQTVDVSAPGVGIFSSVNSTAFNPNPYEYKTGTSMATPMVSGALGLLLSKNPNLSSVEVENKLKSSADNIDTLNPSVQGLIGAGRLNVLKLLKSDLSYSIKSNITIKNDSGDANVQASENVNMSFEFTNEGEAMKDYVQVTVYSPSSFNYLIPVSRTTFILPLLKKGETYKPSFASVFKLADNIPENKEIVCRVGYSFVNANIQENIPSETFTYTFNHPFVNISENRVTMSFANNGDLGFYKNFVNNLLITKGLGFKYKQNNLLKEMGLVIGQSSSKVVNSIRNSNGGVDRNFKALSTVENDLNPISNKDFETSFTDENTTISQRLNVKVTSKILSWKTTPYDKFVIVEYEIKNQNFFSLNNLHIGIYADWDVVSPYSQNRTQDAFNNYGKWDPVTQLLYTANSQYILPFVGIKPLNTLSLGLHSRTINVNSFDFSLANKFGEISSGSGNGDLAGVYYGFDVAQFMGVGPFSISGHQTKKIAFALVVGDDLQDLISTANTAYWKYNFPNGEERLVKPDTACRSQEKILYSIGNKLLKWYDKLSGGTLLHTGSSYTFRTTDKDTVFYVEDVLNPAFIRQQVEVTVIPSKNIVILSGDTTICKGDVVILHADSDADQYLWSTGETTQGVSIENSGKYSVKVTNTKYRCIVESDTIEIKVIDVNEVGPIIANASVCSGDILNLSVQNFDKVKLYEWTGPAGFKKTGNSVNLSNFSVSNVGTYKVKIDFGDCVAEKTKAIEDINKWPTIKLSKNNSLVADITDAPNQWAWGLDGQHIPNAVANELKPLKNGYYEVTAINGNCKRESNLYYYDLVLSNPSKISYTNLKAYPTNHRGKFRLELSKGSKLKELFLFSALGRKIAFTKRELTANTFEIELTSRFIGMLIIKAITQDEIQVAKSFVY